METFSVIMYDMWASYLFLYLIHCQISVALKVSVIQTPFPLNSFGWEYKPRSSLCTQAFHRIESKDHGIHVVDGWMTATKTPSMHHPRRLNMTTFMVGWIKRSNTQKFYPKWWIPEVYLGTQKKRKFVVEVAECLHGLMHFVSGCLGQHS